MSDVCLYCQGSNLTETTVHDRRGMTPTTDAAWYQLTSQQTRYDTNHWCCLVPPHLTTDEVCHQPLMLLGTNWPHNRWGICHQPLMVLGTYWPHNRWGMTPTTDAAWYLLTSQQMRYDTNHWCCLVPTDLTTDKMTPTTDVVSYQLTLQQTRYDTNHWCWLVPTDPANCHKNAGHVLDNYCGNPSGKRLHTQLIRKCSATVISSCWTPVDWS